MKAFSDLSTEDLAEKLWKTAPKVTVELYYGALFGNEALTEAFGPPSRPRSTVGGSSFARSPRSPQRLSIEIQASSSVEHKYLSRVGKLLHALDTNADGTMDKEELKVLFSRLHGIPSAMIDDDHDEVVQFAGMEISAMVKRLVETVPSNKIDSYYRELFREEAAIEHAVDKAAERLTAVFQEEITRAQAGA